MSPDRQLKLSLAGFAVAALCCFTPAAFILLGVLGLAAVTGYLDYVLFPAMAGFGVLAVAAYRKRRAPCQSSKA